VIFKGGPKIDPNELHGQTVKPALLCFFYILKRDTIKREGKHGFNILTAIILELT
jgi:hypothetical protein